MAIVFDEHYSPTVDGTLLYAFDHDRLCPGCNTYPVACVVVSNIEIAANRAFEQHYLLMEYKRKEAVRTLNKPGAFCRCAYMTEGLGT